MKPTHWGLSAGLFLQKPLCPSQSLLKTRNIFLPFSYKLTPFLPLFLPSFLPYINIYCHLIYSKHYVSNQIYKLVYVLALFFFFNASYLNWNLNIIVQ